jgi:hypothetical protein
MLKTFIVDGDKGGVGKSMVTRALVDYYKSAPESGAPGCSVGVVDGDLGNSDVCGVGGINEERLGGPAEILDLKEIDGWAELANQLERYVGDFEGIEAEYRVVISMPAGVGRAMFDGSKPVVNEIMTTINAVPIWVMNRTIESVNALDKRVADNPHTYRHGLVVKNTFFGPADKFEAWEGSEIKGQLRGWLATDFPELYTMANLAVGRTPFWLAGDQGIGDKHRRLGIGEKLALNAWRRAAWKSLAVIERIPCLAEA